MRANTSAPAVAPLPVFQSKSVSDRRLLGDFESVISLDAQISNRRLQLGVPQQGLYCPEILGAYVDQRSFCFAYLVGSVGRAIKIQFGNPVAKNSGVLSRSQMRRKRLVGGQSG